MRKMLTVTLLVWSWMTVAPAAEVVRVLSAGAVEPGLRAFADLVKRETGHELEIQFNTAPQIARRLADGEVFDILISPPAALEQAVTSGKAAGDSRVSIGRVGAGVVVRAAAAAPDVTTPDALRQSLLAADSIVYNTASTGIYLDTLFAQMGILEQLRPKTTRHPNGDAVMEHIAKGTGNEIGFGAITEIRMNEPRGIKLVGPLPPAVQNYTRYDAALMIGSRPAAAVVLQQLATPAGKAAFASRGVE